MRKYRKWVLTLGIMAATPGIVAAANPLAKFFGRKPAPTPAASARPAANQFSNQQVAENIARALRSAKLNGYEMQVEFSGGVCTLIGKIGSPIQQKQAEKVVLTVSGVKRVVNRLTVIAKKRSPFAGLQTDKRNVKQAAYRTDSRNRRSGVRFAGQQTPAPQATNIRQNQQMAERIAKSLKSAGLSGYDIEIRFQNGIAQLSGSVANAQQRSRASQMVKQIPGVNRVSNLLTVAFQRPLQQQPMGRRPNISPAAYQAQGNRAAMPAPQGYGHAGPGARQAVYNRANLPESAWPSYASYPNYAQVTYPKQYSASAWPYIGPFYPYPQVPLGWRQVQLEWDDGYWNLNFRPRTDKWWWFLNPKNW